MTYSDQDNIFVNYINLTSLNADFFELPYANRETSMYVLLPRNNDTLQTILTTPSLLNQLTSTNIDNYISQMTYQ